jgi:hypothetical protein
VATNGYSKVQTRREEEEEEEETEREDAAESGFARPHPQPGMAKCNSQAVSASGGWITDFLQQESNGPVLSKLPLKHPWIIDGFLAWGSRLSEPAACSDQGPF